MFEFENQEKQEGYDSDGQAITAGGQRITRSNYVSKDQYLQEREILQTYNNIKKLDGHIKENYNRDTKNKKSINREKMEAMRNSV